MAPPRDAVWAAAIDSATAVEASAVGLAAYTRGRLDDAAAALTRARDLSTTDLAAFAEFNLGFVLGQLDRPHEALAAYQQVIDTYRDDPTPALREVVATALNNRGFRLGQLDRRDEELAAYQQIIDTYREDPGVRELVELAIVALGELAGDGAQD